MLISPYGAQLSCFHCSVCSHSAVHKKTKSAIIANKNTIKHNLKKKKDSFKINKEFKNNLLFSDNNYIMVVPLQEHDLHVQVLSANNY